MDLSKLSEKVPASRVEKRAGKGGTKLDYVTARFCMDDSIRLDENWRNEYKSGTPYLRVSVKCDGEWVTIGMLVSLLLRLKRELFSAFKRACVHLGIARELYHKSSEALRARWKLRLGYRTSTAVTSVDNWESVQIHFGKNAGVRSVLTNQLEWYRLNGRSEIDHRTTTFTSKSTGYV